MNGEQWKQAFRLFKSLSTLPPQETAGLLEQSNEDPEIVEAVRQVLTGDLPESLWRTGMTLGRYAVAEPLGRGGYGEVYRGQDTVLGRAVALKFLLSKAQLTKPAARRLLEEAQAASALNHPNIVTVHEVIDTESGPVMVMELVEGTSLREVLRNPIPAERTQRYGVQLLEALAAAHAHGIVHRDVKPENIIVRPDGYLKVLDFGLARLQVIGGEVPLPATGGGMPSGTLRYVSPEQCRGEPATVASDLFAAGLVLYEMAAGQHAFPGDTPVATAHAILRSAPRTKPAGPLADVTMRLLEKNPANRPSAAQALELLRAAARRRRHWKWGLGVAAAVAVLAVGGAASRWRVKSASTFVDSFRPLETSASNEITAGAVSPDGRLFAFADSKGVLRSLEWERGREAEIARIPDERITRIAWLGREPRLLLSSRREASDETSGIIRIVDLPTGELRQLPSRGRSAIPSPDATQIAYATLDGRAIEVASRESGQVVRRVDVNDPTGIKTFVWSPTGKLLHYWTVPEGRFDAWRWTKSVMHTVDVASGKLTGRQTMPPLRTAEMLGDGRIIYTIGRLMEVDADPSTGKLLSEPRGLAGDRLEGTMTSSLDGHVTVALIRARIMPSVHTGQLDPVTRHLKNPQPLTAATTESFPHAWTPDSESVLYESARMGRQPLFRHRLGQKLADPMADSPASYQYIPQVSPDGKWLVFLSRSAQPAARVMRMPLAGGPVEEVPGGPTQEFNCQYRAIRCVARQYGDGQAVFYELDPLAGRGRELIRVPMGQPDFFDWSLSPDGRKVAMVDASRFPAAIRVWDLDRPGQEQRIELEGPIPSGGLPAWAIDGKGWFLAQEADRMMYFDTQGHGHFVHDVGFWAVPSWDGKKLAFLDSSRDVTAWLLFR